MSETGLTREQVHQLVKGLRSRYEQAKKAERGRLLDALCLASGYHRKAAIRLLRHGKAAEARGREARGRASRYGPAEVAALRQVWEVSGRSCGKRLAPQVAPLLAALERHGELALPEAVRNRLLGVSAATIDRLMRPERQRLGVRRGAGSGMTAALRAQIPVRTFGEWGEVAPGACQGDLVMHGGETTAGFSLCSLVLVDIALGWSDCEAVWGKGQARVRAALHAIRGRLPVALRELHTPPTAAPQVPGFGVSQWGGRALLSA